MKRILLVAGLLSFFPASAWAAGCGCGTINAMITSAKSSTIQAVNAYTAAEAQAIRSEILLAAQNIVGTMKTEAATIVRAIVALKESNTAAIKGQAVADQAVRTEDMYGKGAQPAGLCGASSVGAGLQLGTKAGQELHQNMREKQLSHADDAKAKPIEHMNRLLDKEHPSGVEMLESLFPLQGTLTEEQTSLAHESIKTLTNPRPLPVVTEAQKNTPAGQTYAASRVIYEGRRNTAAEALSDHVVRMAPTLPDEVTEWAMKQWKEAGGNGNPPGLVDGKLSESGLYKLLSQMRVANPNWFSQVAASTDTGLLRELALMQAFQLELTRKNNELLDRLTVLLSLDYLTRLEAAEGKEMDDLYMRMVGSQQ